jgi:hypothetical protein
LQDEIRNALKAEFARRYRENPSNLLTKELVVNLTSTSLGYADRSPLEPWRYSTPAANRAFIIDFAAAVVESPLLRLPLQEGRRGITSSLFVHVPFALVFSRSQSRTSCLFKDGFIHSPWVYFDSHTDPVTVIEYDSLEDMYGSPIDDQARITIELYVTSRDHDAMQPSRPLLQNYLHSVLALPSHIAVSPLDLH